MDLTLVILAAGMGSRFGGLKQITSINKSGESIIDFSIYDAVKAGFKKVIIIIRPEIKKDFHEFFGNRFENHLQLKYAYQITDDIKIKARKKPLGTAHALLSVQKLVDGPFSVINADDFYGKESFLKAANFLNSDRRAGSHAVIGYLLGQTLSDHGSVSRAECRVDEHNQLLNIRELLKVFKKGDQVYYTSDNVEYPLSRETPVSMNFWCFKPDVFQYLESDFKKFIKKLPIEPDSEFLIPDVVNRMIRNRRGRFHVISTKGPWFGITYKEDFEAIAHGISDLLTSELYPSPLWK